MTDLTLSFVNLESAFGRSSQVARLGSSCSYVRAGPRHVAGRSLHVRWAVFPLHLRVVEAPWRDDR